jgi:hypothetical protein
VKSLGTSRAKRRVPGKYDPIFWLNLSKSPHNTNTVVFSFKTTLSHQLKNAFPEKNAPFYLLKIFDYKLLYMERAFIWRLRSKYLPSWIGARPPDPGKSICVRGLWVFFKFVSVGEIWCD